MTLEGPGLAATSADATAVRHPRASPPPNDAGRSAPGEPRSRKGPPDKAAKPKRETNARRARRVRRIVRRIDAWSVLKFSLIFFFCVFLILLVAGVLLWSAARSAGTIEGVEGFIEDVGGYEFFRFEGDQIFRAAALGGLVLVVAGAAGAVLLAVLFNLISDLTGGIRISVIEEDPAVPGPGSRGDTGPATSGRGRRPADDARPSRPPSLTEL